MPRSGRRPGPGGTKETILAAARTHFGAAGYDRGTIRGIAAEAGVDPALVLHYFGSKEGVFRAAVDFPFDPAELLPRLLAPGLVGIGERLVRFFLDTWDSPAGSPMLGVIRSVVGSESAAAMMREFVSREVLGRLADATQRDQPQVRAGLAASHLIGLAMVRYVIRLEPLASASPELIAAWVGPAIQSYLTAPSLETPRSQPSRENKTKMRGTA